MKKILFKFLPLLLPWNSGFVPGYMRKFCNMVGALLSTVFPFSASFSYYLSISLCYFYLMWAQCVIWGVRLNRVNRGGETRSRHLVLWSRNHAYSTLTWKDQSYYQCMGSEFRYSLGKVIGTQDHPTRGQLPLIVSYVLILLKAHSRLHLNTHTHQHATWHFIPRPNIHLSCSSTNPNIHLS